jgi:hypothetical protein
VRLPKRRITIPVTVIGVLSLAAVIVFQTGAFHARAVSVDPCDAGDTLQCLKTIDDDRTPVDDVGQATGDQDNTAGNPRLGKNVFVNDPCLDPAPPANYNSLPPTDEASRAARRRTVQSETTIGVLNSSGSKKMVAGYNDSFGFYDNRQGLSGYAYTVDGGAHWIDGGGLPTNGPDDLIAGDPVIAVDQNSGTFYFSSIYITSTGFQTMAVNRGRFQTAPPALIESNSNTRCANNPALSGTPDTTNLPTQRIVWEKPVVAVNNLKCDPTAGCDALDKEWLFVNQKTGELYMTYTRFNFDGSTPLELVRSMDGGQTWTAPTTIVPNLDDTFNQATQPVVLPNGRVVVSWIARTFDIVNPPFPEIRNQIQEAYSDNDGVTFHSPIVVATVNPQAEPPGYNRGRASILNAPFMTFAGMGQGDQGNNNQQGDDSGATLYITYFNGRTVLPHATPWLSQGDILLSRSTDGGKTWKAPVKVNNDAGTTSHVFPNVQATNDGKVYVAWLDRRNDPANELTNEWADVSNNGGVSFGVDKVQSDVATTWRARADARPNFGDYNSSVLLGNGQLALVWADGRFTPVAGTPATPDTIFSIASGLANENQQ